MTAVKNLKIEVHKTKEEDVNLPFWDHVEEFKNRFIRCLLIIGLFSALAYYFSPEWIEAFKLPIKLNQSIEKGFFERIINNGEMPKKYSLPENFKITALKDGTIVNSAVILSPSGEVEYTYFTKPPIFVLMTPYEGFFIQVKFSFFIGFLFASPFLIWQLLQFIFPAFRRQIRKRLALFFTLAFVFLSLGLLFGYLLMLPLAFNYFLEIGEGMGAPYWSFLAYLDFSLLLLMGAALSFEAFLALVFLVHYQAIPKEALIKFRKPYILIAFILGALLTPPDVLSQLLLAFLLIAVYETALIYAKIKHKTSL